MHIHSLCYPLIKTLSLRGTHRLSIKTFTITACFIEHNTSQSQRQPKNSQHTTSKQRSPILLRNLRRRRNILRRARRSTHTTHTTRRGRSSNTRRRTPGIRRCVFAPARDGATGGDAVEVVRVVVNAIGNPLLAHEVGDGVYVGGDVGFAAVGAGAGVLEGAGCALVFAGGDAADLGAGVELGAAPVWMC